MFSYVIIGFIVWTRKFVGFGDKIDDVHVRTKQKHEFATPLTIIRVIYCRNIAERSKNIIFLLKMTILSKSLIYYL